MPQPAQQSVRQLPKVQLKDDHQFLKKVDGQFYVTLGAILLRAGYSQACTGRAVALERGTAHTKGLRIGMPAQNAGIRAINLTWQGGDNGSRVAITLCAPPSVEPALFREQLIAAQQALTEMRAVESAKKPSVPQLTVVTTESAAPSEPPAPASMEEQSMQSENTPASSAQAQETDAAPQAQASIRIADDPEKVELFYHYILPHVTGDGSVATKVCSEVLQKHFGVGKTGTGRIMLSLCKRKHMRDVPNSAFYKIPAVALRRLRGDATPSAQHSNGAQAPHSEPRPGETQPERPRRVRAVKPSELVGKLGELESQAKLIEPLEKELEKLDRDVAKLNARRPEIIAQLEICRGAQQTVAQIQSTLETLTKED